VGGILGALVLIVGICAFAWYKAKTHSKANDVYKELRASSSDKNPLFWEMTNVRSGGEQASGGPAAVIRKPEPAVSANTQRQY